jgi:hypothetical protein
MKNVLAFCLVFVALIAGRVQATEYVCELTLAPPAAAPTMGNNGYISMYTTPSPGCAGGSTEKYVCSKGATSHLCGVNAQYSEAALISIYETLRSAETEQHPIVPYWNACISAGGSCVGGVLLYPAL